MSACDERRIPGIKRVPVATLVEICGNEPGIPAFEAQSLDVSGRGMHVKTSFVPQVGDPLICRFENQGQEIVVEGQVAWRREGDTGGDFGIEFTALDSSSVEALRSLCGVGPAASPQEEEPSGQPEEQEQPQSCASGAKVRLHIEGLGAPMKANVKDGSRRRVHVGSQLSFLQVGRKLEIEDMSGGARRHARIDSVDIRVDPRSQVPELVVALRYDGVEDTTPEPSVIDQRSEAEPRSFDLRGSAAPALEPAGDTDEQELQSEEAEMIAEQRAAEQAERAVERLNGAAQEAQKVAKATGETLARLGHCAASGAGQLFKGAGKQLLSLRQHKAAPAPRRQTAPPPGGPRAFQSSRLRPQRSGANQPAPRQTKPPQSEPARSKGSKLALVAGALVVIGATAAYGLRDVDGGPLESLPPLAASALPPKAPKPLKIEAPKEKQAATESGGIVANVPLFGPTPMATMEPAPLGAAPAGENEDEEAAEKAAAAASVEDATWSEEGSVAKPADVKPWGKGRMHLPTIHKLRLDAPGGAISGAVNATGFTVVIPGRKVMESGRAIQRRDQRIVQVKTSNQAAGAQVTFQFRGKVPAYRVRLRKDFAEFLISAPQN